MNTTASAASQPATPNAAMIPVQIVRREVAARDVITLWLAAPGTTAAPAPYVPGQFITLALPKDRETLYRSYSLCGNGRGDRPWEITVKRQHAGLVSSFLYERAAPGEVLYASAPRGSFVLPRPIAAGMPIVFVAAGSGIAPIYGMLRALALLPPQGRPRVQLHYASNAPDEIIYRRELAALDPDRTWLVQWHYLASSSGRLTPDVVLSRVGTLTRAAHWYVCGPDALKRAMQGVLGRQGVAAAQIHVESFGGSQGSRSGGYSRPLMDGMETSGVTAARVRIATTGTTLDARPNETLLEALERNGYHPPFTCRAGVCGDCRMRLLAGRVGGPDGEGLTPHERAAGYVLSCVARPLGDVTIAGAGYDARGTAAVATGSHSPAKTMLRVSLAAASVAAFAGALHLTSTPAASASDGNGTYT
ncbi:MAG: 2Fe-2S iron-sulfur cluster-binding protein, partial [Ktedonobacterales bacterium]